MGRIAIAVAPGVGRVLGYVGGINQVKVQITDAIANGEAFAGQTAIRLPRRIRSTKGNK